MSGLLAAFVIVMGSGLSLQPLLNARIAGLAGNPLYGAALSVTVSTITLTCIILAARLPWPNIRALATAPWWMWAGGVIGAFVVLSALMATPRLGAATTVALFIAGQLAASLLIDRFGILGVPVRELSALRVLGVGCLFAGVMLIRWG